MADILPFVSRAKSVVDVDDLAAHFVEEEIGHYDFTNNWAKAKNRGNMLARVTAWLKRLNVEVEPQQVINAIDRLAEKLPGRWM